MDGIWSVWSATNWSTIDALALLANHVEHHFSPASSSFGLFTAVAIVLIGASGAAARIHGYAPTTSSKAVG
jgi:hypothetical protein